MKSELTSTKPKVKDFPKPMRSKAQDYVILATGLSQELLEGTVIWSKLKDQLGKHHDNWLAEEFIDLPRTECVIISND